MILRGGQSAADTGGGPAGKVSASVLVIEAPYYADVSQELIAGADAVFEEHGAKYDRLAVPGALEIPQAFNGAVSAGLFDRNSETKFDGVVVLGCVIRGETSHYDIVVNNANHWLMETGIRHNIPIGNAILTTDTHAQAIERAQGGTKGKGGDAARACLRLIEINRAFQGQNA